MSRNTECAGRIGGWIGRLVLLGSLLGLAGCAGGGAATLAQDLALPLNGERAAKITIDAGDGNLTVDSLTGGERLLAGGSLQYLETQDPPTHELVSFGDQVTVTLRGGQAARSPARLPWAACNGATEWQVHVNPTVVNDIAAHSNGGNLHIDLASAAVTAVSAETGGGNVEVVLPQAKGTLAVTARTGAGNATVSIPAGHAARIHASAGLGALDIDPSFSNTAEGTYESAGYQDAADRIEITLATGAGSAIVKTYRQG